MPAAAAPSPANTNTPAKSASASRLAKVQRGRLKMPLRCLFYGPEGVGKSTLAAHAPAPIWLDAEDGSGLLDVARYPFRLGPNGEVLPDSHVPTSYDEVIAAIDDLTINESPYETVVIDTADRLEVLIWKHIIARDSSKVKGGLTGIEDYGYGRGYAVALDEWRALCARLDRLRMVRRMNVIILGHAQIKGFRNPTDEDFDRFLPRINEKAGGYLKEWAEVVGFCCFEDVTTKARGQDRAKGTSTGRRIVKLARDAAFDAKCRFAVPDEVELAEANPWAPFAKAIDEALSIDLPGLERLIAAEVERIGDAELAPKVAAAVEAEVKRGNADALHRFLNDLRRRPAKQAT